MIELLLEPFGYNYMTKAIWVSALVGGVCGFLSCFLILKGWALMGDALAHAVVPGVAIAYLLNLPYAFGAFSSGLIAALAITAVRRLTMLREDAVIGLIFTTLFAIGLLIVSMALCGFRGGGQQGR
jgi:manganese/iron transport system permease protein